MFKNGFQVVSKNLYFLVSGLDPFFWDLGILWVLFGCFLVSLELLLRGICSQKLKKKHKFFKVFEHCGFGLFDTPEGSFGVILAPVGMLWS